MGRSKSFDEEAVLDQALQLFWERGYEATSLSDLEAHLGLGRQSLYNTFGDKHELFLKALQRYRQHFGEAAVAGLNAPDAGLDAIRDFFRWSVDFLTHSGPRRGCMIVNTIAELGPQDPDALLHCTHAREVLERSFRRALTGAKARGEVSRNLDVEATATLLTAQNYGLVPMAKTGATAGELNAAVEALLSRIQ
jgi:TetR/AcrR family transcriptional regulator, transcriptional repressor for nem operon